MESLDLRKYEELVGEIFERFPSVQNVGFGVEAYKPGLERMREFAGLLGNPQDKFRSIHVAGTNGKGSVCSMTASALAAMGYKTGLYTSPHILDFRERMRVLEDNGDRAPDRAVYSLVPHEYVYDFLLKYRSDFDRLQLSFFEITTALAFKWFADIGVDYAVIEVGLGGRLDSTNIITPEVSIITTIGLDHCALLGDTLEKIAAEKAGIIKPGVPVVVGEYQEATAPVFQARAAECGAPLYFAESDGCRAGRTPLWPCGDVPPSRGWHGFPDERPCNDGSLFHQKPSLRDPSHPNGWAPPSYNAEGGMGFLMEEASNHAGPTLDLEGPCQQRNLCTVLTALNIIVTSSDHSSVTSSEVERSHSEERFLRSLRSVEMTGIPFEMTGTVINAVAHTAVRTGFRGRWEYLSREPVTICDIGHNAQALEQNFAKLERMVKDGGYSSLIIVYAVMADKDLDAILPLMPRNAYYIFTTPKGKRALPAKCIKERFLRSLRSVEMTGTVTSSDSSSVTSSDNSFVTSSEVERSQAIDSVAEAVKEAFKVASTQKNPLIYIGGSTFAVAEAIPAVKQIKTQQQ